MDKPRMYESRSIGMKERDQIENESELLGSGACACSEAWGPMDNK